MTYAIYPTRRRPRPSLLRGIRRDRRAMRVHQYVKSGTSNDMREDELTG